MRFYERVGLLQPPRRTPSGHRVYEEADVQRLEFIRRAQQIGLTLEDIRELLRSQGLPQHEACVLVAKRLRARIQALDQQLTTLQSHRQKLAESLAECESAPPGRCPVVRRLLGAGAGPVEE